MIGNAEEATFILRHVRREQSRSYSGSYAVPQAPEGWERLGYGSYRITYLSPSGVAYKVQFGADSYQRNDDEYYRIRKFFLRKLPKGCRIPRVGLFKVGEEYVISMERFTRLLRSFDSYSKSGQEYRAALRRLQGSVRIGDMHDANVAVDIETNQIVPIDWGM